MVIGDRRSHRFAVVLFFDRPWRREAASLMSALSQEQTSGGRAPMSALPPKADITERGWHVR